MPRYIPCEFGHDALNPGIQARLPLYAERAKGIGYLRDLTSSRSNHAFSWTAVAVGHILDTGLLSGNLGFDLAWRSATFHGPGDVSFPASSSPWIGRVVCALLAHWDGPGVKNTYLRLAETITTPNALLEALETFTGGPWSAEKGGEEHVEACVREAEKRIERGFPDAGNFLMERSLLYDASVDAVGAFRREEEEEGGVRGLLGLDGGDEGRALEEVVSRVVREWEKKGKAGVGGCGCD